MRRDLAIVLQSLLFVWMATTILAHSHRRRTIVGDIEQTDELDFDWDEHINNVYEPVNDADQKAGQPAPPTAKFTGKDADGMANFAHKYSHTDVHGKGIVQDMSVKHHHSAMMLKLGGAIHKLECEPTALLLHFTTNAEMLKFKATMVNKGNGTHVSGTRSWGCHRDGKPRAFYRTINAVLRGGVAILHDMVLDDMQVYTRLRLFTTAHRSPFQLVHTVAGYMAHGQKPHKDAHKTAADNDSIGDVEDPNSGITTRRSPPPRMLGSRPGAAPYLDLDEMVKDQEYQEEMYWTDQENQRRAAELKSRRKAKVVENESDEEEVDDEAVDEREDEKDEVAEVDDESKAGDSQRRWGRRRRRRSRRRRRRRRRRSRRRRRFWGRRRRRLFRALVHAFHAVAHAISHAVKAVVKVVKEVAAVIGGTIDLSKHEQLAHINYNKGPDNLPKTMTTIFEYHASHGSIVAQVGAFGVFGLSAVTSIDVSHYHMRSAKFALTGSLDLMIEGKLTANFLYTKDDDKLFATIQGPIITFALGIIPVEIDITLPIKYFANIHLAAKATVTIQVGGSTSKTLGFQLVNGRVESISSGTFHNSFSIHTSVNGEANFGAGFIPSLRLEVESVADANLVLTAGLYCNIKAHFEAGYSVGSPPPPPPAPGSCNLPYIHIDLYSQETIVLDGGINIAMGSIKLYSKILASVTLCTLTQTIYNKCVNPFDLRRGQDGLSGGFSLTSDEVDALMAQEYSPSGRRLLAAPIHFPAGNTNLWRTTGFGHKNASKTLCPDDCSNHGHCKNSEQADGTMLGTCECSDQWRGNACETYDETAFAPKHDLTGKDGKCIHGMGLVMSDLSSCGHKNGARICTDNVTKSYEDEKAALATASQFMDLGLRCHSRMLIFQCHFYLPELAEISGIKTDKYKKLTYKFCMATWEFCGVTQSDAHNKCREAAEGSHPLIKKSLSAATRETHPASRRSIEKYIDEKGGLPREEQDSTSSAMTPMYQLAMDEPEQLRRSGTGVTHANPKETGTCVTLQNSKVCPFKNGRRVFLFDSFVSVGAAESFIDFKLKTNYWRAKPVCATGAKYFECNNYFPDCKGQNNDDGALDIYDDEDDNPPVHSGTVSSGNTTEHSEGIPLKTCYNSCTMMLQTCDLSRSKILCNPTSNPNIALAKYDSQEGVECQMKVQELPEAIKDYSMSLDALDAPPPPPPTGLTSEEKWEISFGVIVGMLCALLMCAACGLVMMNTKYKKAEANYQRLASKGDSHSGFEVGMGGIEEKDEVGVPSAVQGSI